jgi:hypothetical protein
MELNPATCRNRFSTLGLSSNLLARRFSWVHPFYNPLNYGKRMGTYITMMTDMPICKEVVLRKKNCLWTGKIAK